METRYDVLPSSNFYSNSLDVGNSLDITTSHASSLPKDVVLDILSRLPVESLMRFKSVCKSWLSLIKQDAHLIDLHFNRSKSGPNLLYIDPLQDKDIIYTRSTGTFEDGETLQQRIVCGEIVQGSGGDQQVESIISKVRITDDKWFLYNQVLEPVNGLVCFVDRNTHAIKVYNASTREATPWVKSTLLDEENAKIANKKSKKEIKPHSREIYRFGYDPDKREHKVFCFWRLAARSRRHRCNSMERPDYECLEALTVGRDTNWRRINAVPNENNQIKIKQVLPFVSRSRPQVYTDGTIYWSNKEYHWDLCTYSDLEDPTVIVAFDVGSEKYRVIPVPNFILDEPRDELFRLPIGMLVLGGGHVALLYQMEPNVVKLWMLDDGADKKLENCRGNKSNWSSETITLPFCGDNGINAFGIAGCCDKILFECQGQSNNVIVVCLYSYDRGRKTCKKIEMDGVSSFPLPSRRSLVATFTESLFPVSAS